MSTLRTNALEGVDAKNSITIVAGAGNVTTTNVQEGIAKQWFNQSAGETPRGSFNVASITDNQTGDDSYSYTNNMNDTNYASVPAGWRDHDAYHASAENLITTAHNRVRAYTRGGNSTTNSGYKACAVFGDLA